MSGEGSGLAQRLVTAAAKAITQVPSATWSTDAQAATVAVLTELVNKAFPDGEDVDYAYACEELAMDACEALRALEGKPQ